MNSFLTLGERNSIGIKSGLKCGDLLFNSLLLHMTHAVTMSDKCGKHFLFDVIHLFSRKCNTKIEFLNYESFSRNPLSLFNIHIGHELIALMFK